MNHMLASLQRITCQPRIISGTVASMQTLSTRFSWHSATAAAVSCQAKRMGRTNLEAPVAVQAQEEASVPAGTGKQRKKSTSTAQRCLTKAPVQDSEMSMPAPSPVPENISAASCTDSASSFDQTFSSAPLSASSDNANSRTFTAGEPVTSNEEEFSQMIPSQQMPSDTPQGAQVQQVDISSTDDITLQQAFKEVQQEAQTSPFDVEPYAPAYRNLVTMTGTVFGPMDPRDLESGTSITKFKLRVRRPGTSIVDTFLVEAWEDMARRIAMHVKVGDRIQINGSVKQTKWDDPTTFQKQYATVMVCTTCWMIDPTTVPKDIDVRTPEELQKELIDYPKRFWDNRQNKRSEKSPDYTHKDSGDAIWLPSSPTNARSAPPSGFSSTPNVQPMHAVAGGDYGSDYDAASRVSTEASGGFQPSSTTTPQRPSNNQPAGFGAAAPHPASTQSFGAAVGTPGAGAGAPAASPAATFPGAFGGKNPNVPAQQQASGAYNNSSYSSRPWQGRAGGPVDREKLWEMFQQDPSKFWDNRNKKLNPKAPDFKHKDTGEGLWVSSSPAWFDVSQHPARDTQQRSMSQEMKDLWENFDKAPSDFWDNRAKKTNPRAPDFVHKVSRGALWVNSKPDWVSLDSLGHEQLPAAASNSFAGASMS